MADRARLLSVEPGNDLTEALRSVGPDCWVQGSGQLEAVELRVAGEGADPVRALRGRFTLASLSGPAGGPFAVVLARASDTGLQVLAGELIKARSLGVTLAALPSFGASVRRDARVELPAEEPPDPAVAAWAAAAQAEAEQVAEAQAEDDDETVWPEAGDLVHHFAFGLCEVLMALDDRLKIRDLKGPGRIREIRAEMLAISKPEERDGKRFFRLERRG